MSTRAVHDQPAPSQETDLQVSNLDLSVVIPTRGRADLLGRVVRGFLAQDWPDHRFEVVVSVDGAAEGAADGTGALLAGLAAEASATIRVVSGPAGGPAVARNRGIAAARGTIVMMVGDDTIPAGDLVRRHVGAHRAHGDGRETAVAGTAPFTELDGSSTWLSEWMNRKHLGYPWLTPGAEVPFYRFVTSNVSVKRALLEQVGGFDEAFPAAAAEDIELGRRLAAAGMRLFFHPEAHADHVHPHTLGDYRRRMLKTGDALHTLAAKHADVQALTPPGRRRLRVVWTLNPVKSIYFAFLYVWSVGWTLAGWRRAQRARTRAPVDPPQSPARS